MLQSGTELLIFLSPQEVAAEGAKILLELTGGPDRRSLKPRVALSGGSTPQAMYQILHAASPAQVIALRHARYFFGDERAVANDHADSNVRLAMDGFLRHHAVPAEQIHAPNGGAADLKAEAARMTALLARTLPFAKGTNLPEFDLVYLGMGTDGHTASLFPGTAALTANEHGYVANAVPQLNTNRLTLTYPVLNAAKHLVLMVTGANKASVLGDIFRRNGRGAIYPIEHLHAERMTWLLDSAAAAQLPPELLKRARPAG